jgi:hypothetical protein
MSLKTSTIGKNPGGQPGLARATIGILAEDLDDLWREYMHTKGLELKERFSIKTKLDLIEEWIISGEDIDE